MAEGTLTKRPSSAGSFLRKLIRRDMKRTVDRSLLTRTQHDILLSTPRPHALPEEPDRGQTRRCKIPKICPPRIDQLSIPRTIQMMAVLENFNVTLEPERVVRLVKLVHSNRDERPIYTSTRRKPKKKPKKKNKKKECMKIWLEKRTKTSAGMVMSALKTREQFTPNYRQLLVALALMKKMKIKKKRHLPRYTKQYLMKICEQLAIICDSECAPYKQAPKLVPMPPESVESVESRKHIFWKMREGIGEEEEEEGEGEEEGMEAAALKKEEGEEEKEEEEEEEFSVEEVPFTTADEVVELEALLEMAEEEASQLIAESEADDEITGFVTGPEDEVEGELPFDEAQEDIGEGIGGVGEEGGVGRDAGIEDEDFVMVGEETEEPEDITLTTAEDLTVTAGYEGEETAGVPTTDLEEGVVVGQEGGETTDFGDMLESGEEGEGEPTLPRTIDEFEKEILEEEKALEKLAEEEEEEVVEVVLPTEVLVDEHPPNTVSYVSWKIYSSWLEEFGNNIQTYGKCLHKFREILEVATEKEAAKIKTIVSNWGTYLSESMDFEMKISAYFKGKKITKCSKCGDYTLYNMPTDHEVPPELKQATNSTARWKTLLEEAEQLCKSFTEGSIGGVDADALSMVSHETINITDAGLGLSDTSMYIFEDFTPEKKDK